MFVEGDLITIRRPEHLPVEEPEAACEEVGTERAGIAVDTRHELFAQLAELSHRAQQCLARRAERCRERFDLTVCRWPEPQSIFAPTAQRVDELGERLPRSLAARAGNARADMNLVAGRLRPELVEERIARLTDRLSAAWKMAELGS